MIHSSDTVDHAVPSALRDARHLGDSSLHDVAQQLRMLDACIVD